MILHRCGMGLGGAYISKGGYVRLGKCRTLH